MNTSYQNSNPNLTHTLTDLARRGINLPSPLPSRLELSDLLSREIKKIQFTIQRMSADAPDYKQNVDQHLHTIKLIDSLLHAPTPPHIMPQQSAPQTSEENISRLQNSDPSGPPIEIQPHTDGTKPGQSGTNAGQAGTTAGRPGPDLGQTGTVPPQPNQTNLLDELQEIAEELQEHLTGRSPLDRLTEQEQQAVIKLLQQHNTREVAKLLAQPAPIGLNIKTSKSSVSRFHVKWREREALRARRARMEKAEQVFIKHNGDNFKSSIELIEARLFHAASVDETKPEDLQLLIKSITGVRRLALAERKQTHVERH